MSTFIYFKFKDTINGNNSRVVDIFLKSWIDDVCQNHAKYKIVHAPINDNACSSHTPYRDAYRVDFEKQEDAIVARLQGIPSELQKYIEIL